MTKYLSFVLLLLSLTVYGQNIPEYVPRCGLIAWYPFSGNAVDSTLHGNNGVVYGATLTTDRYGHSNAAYSFNGTSNYIYIAAPATLTNSLYLPGSFSISVWVQTTNYAHGGQVFWRGDAAYAHDQYMMYVHGSQMGLRRDVNTGWTTNEITMSLSGVNASFHHFVGSYDSVSGYMKIYFDGNLTTSTYLPGLESYPTSAFYNVIGAVVPADQYFYGKIDDLGVWNRALDLCEVRQLYYSTTGLCLADTAHSFTDTVLCSSSAPAILTARAGYSTYSWNTGVNASSISVDTTGLYWVHSYNSNFCREAIDTFSIIFTSDTSSHHIADTAVCVSSLPVVFSAPAGYGSYSWSTGDTTLSVYASTAGVYWVRYGSGCNISTDTFDLAVLPMNVIVGDTNISQCIAAGPVTLSASVGYSNYIWNTGDTTSYITAPASSIYWVNYSSGCNMFTDTFDLAILPVSLSTHAVDTSVCSAGGAVSLSGPGGYASYNWNTGDTTVSTSVFSSGTYWVNAVDGCNQMSDTFHLVVNIYDTVYRSVDTSSCVPDGIITIQGPPGYDSYYWSIGSTGISATVNATGSYWVLAQNTCSAEIDTFHVIISSLDTSYVRTDTTVCEGISVISLQAPPGYSDYLWSNGATVSSINAIVPGQYWVVVRTGACSIILDTFHLAAQPLPIVFLGNDTAICSGADIVLSSDQPAGAYYVWNNGATTSSITVSHAGNYFLSVTVNGCTAVDSISISNIAQPSVILGNDTTLCNEDGIVIEAKSVTGDILWPGGSTATTYLVSHSGTYWCTASNVCGSVTDSITVHLDTCAVGVPEAFSPNGDGKNDILFVRGTGMKDVNFFVYNRFGQLVFRTDDMMKGWDGSFNGEQQPIEVYGYVVNATMIDGTTKSVKGNVTLVR